MFDINDKNVIILLSKNLFNDGFYDVMKLVESLNFGNIIFTCCSVVSVFSEDEINGMVRFLQDMEKNCPNIGIKKER